MMLLPLLLLLSSLSAEDASCQMQSAHASYEEGKLRLKGGVQLHHALGEMAAEEADLARQAEGSFPFAEVDLRGKVAVDMKERGTMQCDLAHLDFTALQGIAHSKEMGGLIFSKLDRVKIEGKDAQMRMKEGERHEIDSLLFTGGAIARFRNATLTQTDRILYREGGLISALPLDGGRCHLERGVDILEADAIDFDLAKSKLVLKRPVGKLGGAHPAQISGNFLTWFEEKRQILIQGDAHFFSPQFGTLVASELRADLNATGFPLARCEGKGEVVWEWRDEAGRTHTVRGPGPLVFDQKSLSLVIGSGRKQGAPITYVTEGIVLSAREAHLDYAQVDSNIQPTTLTLKGEVQLSALRGESKCGAIADRLTYSIRTRSLNLTASPGRRVLLWDPVKPLQLSADEVVWGRDPSNGRDVIQGLGGVALNLTQEEKSLLMRTFPTLMEPVKK